MNAERTPAGQAAALYVYYKLPASQAAAARAAFEQARGAAPVQLLQRAEVTNDGLLTWMEIYPAGLAGADALQQRLADALRPWMSDARHLERFLPLA